MSPVRRLHRPRLNNRSRGQVMVIFVAAILTFVGLCAIVVDVSWYWANTLRVQRAADSAALAGAVYLPNDPNRAFSEAKLAAIRNGYTDGSNGVVVTPSIDGNDPRQLDVRIDGKVNSFFAHVFGINTWNVARIGEGVYIQPVPMGSPDAYYGVGDFWNWVTTTSIQNTRSNTDSGLNSATTAPGTTWLTSSGTLPNAVLDNDPSSNQNRPYAYTQTDGASQRWGGFGLTSQLAANQTVMAVNGIRVFLDDMFLSGSCSNTRIYVQVSWDGGTTWSLPQTTNQSNTLSTNTADDDWGSATSLANWGTHTWVPGDLADGKFEVRLTADKGTGFGCTTVQVRVDQLRVQAYYNINTATTVSTTTLTQQTVKDPNNAVLQSRGAWGAMLTKGGNHENGDAYGPANNGGTGNTDYDPDGYDYIVSLPSGGTVNVFDPGFCAMGSNGAAGTVGTGDHWVGTEGTPVSTYYTLWNTKGAPGLKSSWTQISSSGTLFENQKGYDPTQVAPGDNPPNNATSGCDPYHEKWWPFPTGNLVAGQYAVTVQTTKPTDGNINKNTNAENMWALDALGSGAQIYGNGRMAVYNNLRVGQANGQLFYLAQVDKQTGINKTMLLDIFDPGDVAGDATLQILSPNGGVQTVAKFNYTTDGNCRSGVSDACSNTSANGVNQLITANNGASSFNNTWVHITIPLTNYGTGGLWQNGWWQIKYITPDGGNDTTTWQVNIQGNPVHLVVP